MLLKINIGLTAAIIAEIFAAVESPYLKPILYAIKIVAQPISVLKNLKSAIDLVLKIHSRIDWIQIGNGPQKYSIPPRSHMRKCFAPTCNV